MTVGFCLNGGGITGAMYQVGCLAALEEHYPGLMGETTVFVGSSSGATIAMALAGGIGPHRLYRALLDPSDDFFPLERHHLMRLDSPELKRVARSALSSVRRLLTDATSKPKSLEFWTEVDRFWDSLPAGLFSLDAFEELLVDFMVRRGIPNVFSELGTKLVITASNLDAGTRAVFGVGALRNVPVSKAIAAASAMPMLYAPFRLQGCDYVDAGIGDVGHADLAQAEGAKLIVVINPLVPVHTDPRERDIPTGHGPMKRVRDKGLLWVSSQATRIRSETRLTDGLARFRNQNPGTTVALLEPDSSDATMFMHSPMNYSARRVILEAGYRTTLAALAELDSPLQYAFESAGVVGKTNVN